MTQQQHGIRRRHRGGMLRVYVAYHQRRAACGSMQHSRNARTRSAYSLKRYRGHLMVRCCAWRTNVCATYFAHRRRLRTYRAGMATQRARSLSGINRVRADIFNQ